MIDVKEKLLHSLIYKAKQLAENKKRKQFLSVTEKIAPVHILSVFDNFQRLNEDRSFWADVQNDFYIVGAGYVKQIIASSNRYEQLHQAWQTFIEKALIHNEYDRAGVGLNAFGGMTFDPLRDKTKLWESFPTSELIVPQISIVKQKTDYYLTLNTFVNKEDDVEDKVRHLETLKGELLYAPLNVKRHRHCIERKDEVARDEWIEAVKRARDEIRNNDIKKIVMAREMIVTLNNVPDLTSIINNLIQTQPNSYVFAFEKGEDCFIGASPERLVRIQDDRVLSTCLAGTAPRGNSKDEDERIKEQLFHDSKNRDEHDYVVQMIRNSIQPFCHDLNIPNEPIVLSLKDLHHLYTPVTATLKEGATIFDFIKHLHPTPALGGEPKAESLAFIRQHERLDRGWYGAPLGWIDEKMNGEFAVAIRSGLIRKQIISLFAGCGVMKDSDPQLEYEETAVKFLPLFNALEAHDESH